MTNYIEELMKAAGVKCSTMCKPIGANCKAGCDNCERRKVFYPAFTPEKQIELIKLIAKSNNFQIEVAANQHECVIGVRYYLSNDKIWGCSKHFELALAETAVELLGLGELDKSEVRRILEDD